jgi:hypothetical protein
LAAGTAYGCFVLVGNGVGDDLCSVESNVVTVTPWRLAAAIDGDGIWTSDNYGRNWHEADAPQRDWDAITSSSDGTRMAAVIQGLGDLGDAIDPGGRIWTSYDYGRSWQEADAPIKNWVAITSSA